MGSFLLRFAAKGLGRIAASIAILSVLVLPSVASAQATLMTGLGGAEGFGTNVLAANDDGSSASIPLSTYNSSGLCFFGSTHTVFYVNNNGNITFGYPVSAYTPTAFPSAPHPMIAPWWADVDTRGTGPGIPPGNTVYWSITAGQIVVTWYQVGYYNSHVDLLDSFQVVINQVTGASDYDVQFRYNQLVWTTGDASGGTDGLGGVPAQAGFDAGDLLNYNTLPGSRTASVLNLLTTSNTTPAQPGVWTYHFRGCVLQCLSNADCAGPTPICDSTSHECRACTSSSDCSGSTPFCATTGDNAGRCVQCLANGNCPTDRCTENACVCATNSDCSGATPICDTTSQSCRACMAGSMDCTGTTPVCGPAGTCVQCAPAITAACVAPTPVCSTSTFACVGCNTNADCATGMMCNTATSTCVVTPVPDAGVDSGVDAGIVDAGTDSGIDAAAPDVAVADAAMDSTIVVDDAGEDDAAPVADSGPVLDAGRHDAGRVDAGRVDTGEEEDSGETDAGEAADVVIVATQDGSVSAITGDGLFSCAAPQRPVHAPAGLLAAAAALVAARRRRTRR